MRKKISRRLIIASNRLPIQLVKHNNKIEFTETDSGLVSALKSYFERNGDETAFVDSCWVGCAEFSDRTWTEFNTNKQSSLPVDVEPIFVEAKTHRRYSGFSNNTLWPLFHY